MTATHPPELWIRCRVCARWAPVHADRTVPSDWTCPVCGGEPDRLENRAFGRQRPAPSERRRAHEHHKVSGRRVPAREHGGPSAGALPEVWYG